MTKKLQSILTRPRFRRWLAAHRPGARVGVKNSRCGCPLATFVRSDFGMGLDEWHRAVVQSRGTIHIEGPTPGLRQFMDLPEWARLFAYRVDRYGEACRPITARRALEILDRCAP